MEFCARNELDMELAALLTKLYLAMAQTNALAAMPFSDIDNYDFRELFPKNPKNYDIAYDEEDGEWSYHRGEWLLSCPAGHNPLDYPLIDDYDDPRD